MSKLSNLGHSLYEGKVSIDFIGRKWLWYSISGLIVLLALYGLLGKGLNLGIEFEGGVEYRVVHEVRRGHPGQRREDPGRGRPDRARLRHPGRRVADREHLRLGQHPDPDRAARQRPGHRDRADDPGHGQSDRRQPGRDRRDLGCPGRATGAARPGGLPGAGGAVHLGVLPRVEDVRRRHRRAGPRPGDHGRRLRAVRVRGHAGHGDRHPDHPGLLALRHRRGLRQGPREHQEPLALPA